MTQPRNILPQPGEYCVALFDQVLEAELMEALLDWYEIPCRVAPLDGQLCVWVRVADPMHLKFCEGLRAGFNAAQSGERRGYKEAADRIKFGDETK